MISVDLDFDVTLFNTTAWICGLLVLGWAALVIIFTEENETFTVTTRRKEHHVDHIFVESLVVCDLFNIFVKLSCQWAISTYDLRLLLLLDLEAPLNFFFDEVVYEIVIVLGCSLPCLSWVGLSLGALLSSWGVNPGWAELTLVIACTRD